MFNFGHWNRPIDADRLHRVNPLLNTCVCFAIVLNETCLVGCMLKMSLVWILKALDSCVRRTPSPCLLFVYYYCICTCLHCWWNLNQSVCRSLLLYLSVLRWWCLLEFTPREPLKYYYSHIFSNLSTRSPTYFLKFFESNSQWSWQFVIK